jgi:hypothetical protein
MRVDEADFAAGHDASASGSCRAGSRGRLTEIAKDTGGARKQEREEWE